MKRNATHHPVNLSKLQRCDQEWEAMSAIPGGRLCQQCDKRIVDFTGMSNADVARIHLESDAPVCGMYRDDQLRKPQRPMVSEIGWRAHPAVLSLVSMLLVEPALNPAQAQTPATEQAELPHVDGVVRDHENVAVAPAPTDTLIIRGRVLEQVDDHDEPAPLVAVFVKGTALGTTTDFDGNFFLDVTELADSTDSVVLVLSYIGYPRMEQLVPLRDPEEVVFRVTSEDMSIIAYAVEYKKPPLHKRIWRGIKRPFQSK